MRRRFLAATAGAIVAALSRHALAQAAAGTRRLGILGLAGPEEFMDGGRAKVLAALADLGYVRGRNLELDERYAQGREVLLAQGAAQLAALKVDAILTEGTPATLFAQRATRTIPIVTSVGDPVAAGFARELARPGANVTGLSQSRTLLAAKQVEMLVEVVRPLHEIAVLYYAEVPGIDLLVRGTVEAVRAAHIEPRPMGHADEGAGASLEECARRGIRAAISMGAGGDRAFAEAALRNRVAVVVLSEAYVPFGAIGSVEGDARDDYPALAAILAKIFRGASPAEIPFMAATRFRTVVNARTAAAIGLRITDSLRLRADRVIE
jgi:putative ABC transport system substrate-binding protein